MHWRELVVRDTSWTSGARPTQVPDGLTKTRNIPIGSDVVVAARPIGEAATTTKYSSLLELPTLEEDVLIPIHS